MIKERYRQLIQQAVDHQTGLKLLEGSVRDKAAEKVKIIHSLKDGEYKITNIVPNGLLYSSVWQFPVTVFFNVSKADELDGFRIVVLDHDEVLDADLAELKKRWAEEVTSA